MNKCAGHECGRNVSEGEALCAYCKEAEATVSIPRSLAVASVRMLLSAPAADVYALVREWDDAVPGLLVRDDQAA